jgi:hypothetical protein
MESLTYLSSTSGAGPVGSEQRSNTPANEGIEHPVESQDQGTAVPEWQVIVNGLLYTVQFDESLDERVVTEVSDLIKRGKVLEGGKNLYASAIRVALAESHQLTSFIPEAHGESEFRDFLVALLGALEEQQ